jgi:hypothetical protein
MLAFAAHAKALEQFHRSNTTLRTPEEKDEHRKTLHLSHEYMADLLELYHTHETDPANSAALNLPTGNIQPQHIVGFESIYGRRRIKVVKTEHPHLINNINSYIWQQLKMQNGGNEHVRVLEGTLVFFNTARLNGRTFQVKPNGAALVQYYEPCTNSKTLARLVGLFSVKALLFQKNSADACHCNAGTFSCGHIEGTPSREIQFEGALLRHIPRATAYMLPGQDNSEFDYVLNPDLAPYPHGLDWLAAKRDAQTRNAQPVIQVRRLVQHVVVGPKFVGQTASPLHAADKFGLLIPVELRC